MSERLHFPDWKSLPYAAPYYIYYPTPDKLQIWVKPRYWFAIFAGVIGTCILILAVLPGEPFDQVMGFILGLFGVGYKLADVKMWFPFIFVSWPAFVGIMMGLYKRTGLIEVTPEGVRIVENPRLSPRKQNFIPRSDIHGFDDQEFTVRLQQAGTQLKLNTHSGKVINLIKIWGADRLNSHDYRILSGAVKNAYAGIKPKAPSEKSVKQKGKISTKKNPPVSPNTPEIVLKSAQRNAPETYRKWEKICLPICAGYFCFICAYYTFSPQSGHFILIAAAWLGMGYVFLRTLRWPLVLQESPDKMRGWFLTAVVLAAWSLPGFAASSMRRSELSSGRTAAGKVLSCIDHSSRKSSDFALTVQYAVSGKTYEPTLRLRRRYDVKMPLVVQIGSSLPSIFEIDWDQAEKLWEEQKQREAEDG